MNPGGFFLSWMISSITMFLSSYLWHGVILNDLQRLTYPIGIFLTGAIIAYLILGFLLTKIYLMKFPHSIAKKPLLRGVISGALLGVCTYITAIVVGVSFNTQMKPEYILIDLLWQTTEQILGGITVGFIYIWIYEGNPIEVFIRKMTNS